MNTRDLALFRAVVKYKNYTYVAEKFGLSQPAVTQAIKRLEVEFDAPLVKQDHAHQQIRFGLPPILGALFFPQVARQLLKWGWLKQVDVIEKGSAELLNELTTGKLDIALVASAHPLHLRGVQTISLGTRPFEIIVSEKNALAQRTQISFEELADQKFIGLDDSFIHPRAFRDFCQAAGVKPEVIYKTSDIAWMKSIVRANLGLGFLVKDAILPNDQLVGLRITDRLIEHFRISVAYRKGYVLSKHEASLLQILLKIKV